MEHLPISNEDNTSSLCLDLHGDITYPSSEDTTLCVALEHRKEPPQGDHHEHITPLAALVDDLVKRADMFDDKDIKVLARRFEEAAARFALAADQVRECLG